MSLMEGSTMVWFKPTEAFFAYFNQVPWRWKLFHDCGAGMGHLTKEMRKRKFDVKAYDLFPRGDALIPDIIRANTKDIAFGLQDCAILARPCHHPEFIDVTLDNILRDGDAFYVGLAKNMVEDLQNYKFEPVAGNVGEAGEVLVRVFGHVDRLHEYRKIKSPSGVGGAQWWWYNPKRNRYGSQPDCRSGFDAIGNEIVLDTQYYENDLQVSSPKSEGCDDDSIYGWIAPDGEWFGCSYAGHDTIMQNVIGIQVRRAEELRFCRCQGGAGSGGNAMLWSQRGLEDVFRTTTTPKQRATLKARGYDPKR